MPKRFISVVVFSFALYAQTAAAATKTYQVTGPVLEVTPEMIVVQKGQDRWEIARDGTTNVTGELKVGAKVTIHYRMSATSVEVTAATAKTPAKKGK
jgi:hypothetical protein